eukprot:820847-Lingulodinium_polyedra.AAC.1
MDIRNWTCSIPPCRTQNFEDEHAKPGSSNAAAINRPWLQPSARRQPARSPRPAARYRWKRTPATW